MERKQKTSRSAADYLPAASTLSALRRAAESCRGCDLYRDATQTVFGEGRRGARIMFVGEQPGDQEDVAGKPFVGPAGRLLRKAMAAAGIDPADTYVTNAVKHFKFVWRGKRRIHAKPRRIEIRACRPWLEAEIAAVRPGAVIALGATAAQALLGTEFRLTKHRGQPQASPLGVPVLATLHPASILRDPDAASRHAALAEFVEDLRRAKRM